MAALFVVEGWVETKGLGAAAGGGSDELVLRIDARPVLLQPEAACSETPASPALSVAVPKRGWAH